MKILVDADSCPVAVREIILRAAKRTGVKAIFAANRPIPGTEAEGVTMELCSSEPGAADDRIVELSEKGDLVITRDVPLAARLVDKESAVMDDRGRVFTRENIRAFLSLRDFQVGLAESGAEIVRIPNYGKKDLKMFADSFDRTLMSLLHGKTL
jgi:uncharacterized protein YaiI (UPF0178 family)